MVEKLKSISKRIRWSLLLKAAIFAVAWILFPFWLFVLVALYLYFVPVSQSKTVAGPFFTLLLVSFLNPVSPIFAFILGIIFLYILLIKDLVLIDRASAYEVTVLFLTFLLLLDFYIKEGGSFNVFSLLYSLCVALIVGYLLSTFVRMAAPQGAASSEAGSSKRPLLIRTALWISTLLLWQFIIVGLFLPVDFVYQTVTVFLGAIFIIDLIPQYLFGQLSRQKIMVTLSILFILFVFVLGSARWGL
jgi:hypothetical protein